jgi:hypothetical protein
VGLPVSRETGKPGGSEPTGAFHVKHSRMPLLEKFPPLPTKPLQIPIFFCETFDEMREVVYNKPVTIPG